LVCKLIDADRNMIIFVCRYPSFIDLFIIFTEKDLLPENELMVFLIIHREKIFSRKDIAIVMNSILHNYNLELRVY